MSQMANGKGKEMTQYMSKTQIKNRAEKAGIQLSQTTGRLGMFRTIGLVVETEQDGWMSVWYYTTALARDTAQEFLAGETAKLEAFLATMEERDGLYRMAR